MNVLVATRRAGPRNAVLKTTVMTAQAFVSQMQHHVGGTAPATGNPATSRTRQHRRVAPSVEKDQTLLTALQTLTNRRQQGLADSFLEHHPASVEHMHGGQTGQRIRPQFQDRQPVTAIFRIRPGFQRRRSRTQHNGNGRLPGSHHGQITRRITHPVLLLERRVVLFVDDDQPQARHGRKN